jgi:hypothetical protein
MNELKTRWAFSEPYLSVTPNEITEFKCRFSKKLKTQMNTDDTASSPLSAMN